jgi:hypothetical protein
VVAKLLKRHPWLPTVRLFDAAVVVATFEICSPAIEALLLPRVGEALL